MDMTWFFMGKVGWQEPTNVFNYRTQQLDAGRSRRARGRNKSYRACDFIWAMICIISQFPPSVGVV